VVTEDRWRIESKGRLERPPFSLMFARFSSAVGGRLRRTMRALLDGQLLLADQPGDPAAQRLGGARLSRTVRALLDGQLLLLADQSGDPAAQRLGGGRLRHTMRALLDGQLLLLADQPGDPSSPAPRRRSTAQHHASAARWPAPPASRPAWRPSSPAPQRARLRHTLRAQFDGRRLRSSPGQPCGSAALAALAMR
jgi:hypothetical protein